MGRRNVNNVCDTNTGISTTGEGMVLDEVDGINELELFDSEEEDPQSIHLDEDVTMQLRKYILIISSKYNKNCKSMKLYEFNVLVMIKEFLTLLFIFYLYSAFHNFE